MLKLKKVFIFGLITIIFCNCNIKGRLQGKNMQSIEEEIVSKVLQAESEKDFNEIKIFMENKDTLETLDNPYEFINNLIRSVTSKDEEKEKVISKRNFFIYVINKYENKIKIENLNLLIYLSSLPYEIIVLKLFRLIDNPKKFLITDVNLLVIHIHEKYKNNSLILDEDIKHIKELYYLIYLNSKLYLSNRPFAILIDTYLGPHLLTYLFFAFYFVFFPMFCLTLSATIIF